LRFYLATQGKIASTKQSFVIASEVEKSLTVQFG